METGRTTSLRTSPPWRIGSGGNTSMSCTTIPCAGCSKFPIASWLTWESISPCISMRNASENLPNDFAAVGKVLILFTMQTGSPTLHELVNCVGFGDVLHAPGKQVIGIYDVQGSRKFDGKLVGELVFASILARHRERVSRFDHSRDGMAIKWLYIYSDKHRRMLHIQLRPRILVLQSLSLILRLIFRVPSRSSPAISRKGRRYNRTRQG